jgi:hypothetical protein
MNLETKITIYKFTPQVFTLTHISAQFENSTYFILLYPYTALLPISSSMRNN